MDRTTPLFPDGDGVGFELVCGDAGLREALSLQKPSKQFPRRVSAAASLHQEVEHFAFIVDPPPQPVFSTAYPDDHLVEMQTGARPWTAT